MSLCCSCFYIYYVEFLNLRITLDWHTSCISPVSQVARGLERERRFILRSNGGEGPSCLNLCCYLKGTHLILLIPNSSFKWSVHNSRELFLKKYCRTLSNMLTESVVLSIWECWVIPFLALWSMDNTQNADENPASLVPPDGWETGIYQMDCYLYRIRHTFASHFFPLPYASLSEMF